ncbi:MAG: QacE family quaternary ammonium compound efflux SMR transporter [Candidatus Competibacteraceae bacterium]|nr:QacE family quaternary ammonium compound efflux SMR transporter [Candidatus Competibacteraceae bacterium]
MSLASLYLVVAAVIQVCWLYTVKAIDRKKLSAIQINHIFSKNATLALLPLIGYFVFGISNVVMLTLAMKKMPPSVTYALWSGMVIALAAFVDQIFFKLRFSVLQYIFLVCIAIGVIGLNFSTK